MAHTKQTRQSTLSGDLLVIFAMAIFGSYSLFLRLCPGIPMLTFLFAFQVVGASAFWVLSSRHGFPRLNRRDALLLFALAVVALANDFCYFAAFRTTSVANAAVAHQSVSIFLVLLAPWLLRERTHRDEWIALMISLVGIGILYSKALGVDMADIKGISFGVLSGLFYALLIVLYRTIPDETRGLGISVVNFWRYLISTAFLIPLTSQMGVGSIGASDLMPLVGFGLLFGVVASGIHNVGISKTRSLHVSILGKSEPVFAALYAFLFLHETPSTRALIGAVLIIGSSTWLAFRKGE